MPEDLPSLLLVDDDVTFRTVLGRALVKRGFAVTSAADVNEAVMLANQNPPEYAVVDLKLPGDSGLHLVALLKQLDENTRIVMLTGYASIATAIEAIKLGATHYLAKPAEVDEIIAALYRNDGNADISLNPKPPSVGRLEWEHIQRVLIENDNNISATARALSMHRRTLQRKLAKNPVRN
jgi:two-component system response regulator RegA